MRKINLFFAFLSILIRSSDQNWASVNWLQFYKDSTIIDAIETCSQKECIEKLKPYLNRLDEIILSLGTDFKQKHEYLLQILEIAKTIENEEIKSELKASIAKIASQSDFSQINRRHHQEIYNLFGGHDKYLKYKILYSPIMEMKKASITNIERAVNFLKTKVSHRQLCNTSQISEHLALKRDAEEAIESYRKRVAVK